MKLSGGRMATKQREWRHPHRRAGVQAFLERLESRVLLAATWQSVAIGGGGYVTGLAASTDGANIYMRTDVGGAYRWNPAASSWTPITESLPNDSGNNGPTFGIGSLAVDPTNGNRVFAAVGKYNYSSPSGIYYTTDSSAATPAWTVIDSTIKVLGNGSLRQTGERLAVDPNNVNVLYYGTNNVSASGGSGLKKYYYDTSWHAGTLVTPAVGDTNYGITFVAVDANGGTVSDGTRLVSRYLYIGVYGATVGSGGVYASSDGGATWTKVTGLNANKPARGEVASDGTLYVTHEAGVAKVARGTTAFTSITPAAGLGYNALAVDPASPGTIMVAEFTTTNTVYRSTNGGASWVTVTRTIHATEPDGTPSVTSTGKLDHVADLMINPAATTEVWISDFYGVQRTQNIKNNSSASDWYVLQRNHEEVVPLALTSAPEGAPLLSALADVNGFVHVDPAVRPTWTDRFEIPTYISTTSLDFSESTSGDRTVWARVGDVIYDDGYNNGDGGPGGISLDDGLNWAGFGQLDAKKITNSSSAAWEAFDVGPYLKQLRAAGATSVTFVLRGFSNATPNASLRFSSREGGNTPQLLINGSTTLANTADATVNAGASTTNYGLAADLQVKNYFGQTNNMLWSFIKFDLSSVASITSATLRLYRLASADSTSFTTQIYASATTNWVEGDGGTNNIPAGEITWSNKPADLTAAPGGAMGGRIAVSPTDPTTLVWVAENGYVWFSKDRGVTWSRGTLNGISLTVNSMTEFQVNRMPLASDRVAPDTFYLYATTGGGTLYRSTNGGATWSTLASNAGTVDANSYPNGFKLETLPGVSGRFWLSTQTANAAGVFKYWNGSSMTMVPSISGVVDFSFGKAAPGSTNPTVFVRKSNQTYWYSTNATAGTTATWVQMDVEAVNDAPNILEGDRQVFGRLYVGTGGRGIFYAQTSTCTWDGGPAGTGTSWNVAANWSPDGIPTAGSTVIFTDAGLTSGKTITLDGNQSAYLVVLATTTPFSIGSGSIYSLTLSSVDRQDMAGAEVDQIIASPVVLVANSQWTVNGGGALTVTGPISGAYNLTKLGAGQLAVAANAYTGDTTVLGGTLTATADGSIHGNLTVGDGTHPAAFSTVGTSDAIADTSNVTVNANASVTFGAAVEVISGLTVAGGAFAANDTTATGPIVLTGAVIGGTGVLAVDYGSVVVNADDRATTISTGLNLPAARNMTFAVGRGSVPIDLHVAGSLGGGAAGFSVTKTGPGIMLISGNSTQTDGSFNVVEGTLLVNNTSGSATGASAVTVSATTANATLGGVGTIGGVAGYAGANVTVSGTASYLATLAPGSIDATSGAHLSGILTIGSAAQNNHLTLNDYSQVSLNVNPEARDQLEINGNVTIAANTTLILTCTGSLTQPAYTLASWTGTRTGAFATITGVPAGYDLKYGPASIVLVKGPTVTWDGGPAGTGTSWNVAANWSSDQLPTPSSTVVFTSSGLSSGKVITLDADQTVYAITIATTTGFTIGSVSGNTLTLTNLERQDVTGTEASHTLAAPVILYGNATWSVAGSGVLTSTGGVSGANSLTKLGAGELDLSANAYTGDTIVLAGTLKPTANGAVQGNLIVGGGTASATFTPNGLSNALAKGVTVNSNGTVTLAGSENITNLTINGGTFNTNYSYVNGTIAMTGGTLGGTGGIYGTHTTVTTLPSETTAFFTAGNNLSTSLNSSYNVGDGAAIVDLKVTGTLFTGGSALSLTKSGAGTMMLTAGNSHANSTFSITSGTLLVNNTSGSGTGQSAVVLNATSANATLGGTGIIGGVTGYANANVTLTGSTAYVATLAPGSIHEITGTHIFGVLTIGSATQNNNVTFNDESQLLLNVSSNSNDALTVNGDLTIAAGTTLNIVGIPALASYTLASWTGTRTGTFVTVTGVPDGYVLEYKANKITLSQRFTGVFTGTDGNDVYTVRLSPDTTQLQIWEGPFTGDPTYAVPLSQVTSLSFSLGLGDDTLTLDGTYGTPVDAYGLAFDGGAGSNTVNFSGGTYYITNAFFEISGDLSINISGDTWVTLGDPPPSANVAPLSLDGTLAAMYAVLPATQEPALAVTHNGIGLASGQTLDIGAVPLGEASPTQVFVITNTGSVAVDVENPIVPAGFVLTQAPAARLDPGDSTAFHIALDCTSFGNQTGPLTIPLADGETMTLTLIGSVSIPIGTGLLGHYYASESLTFLRATRTESVLSFNWARGAPIASIGQDHFSAAWTGQILPLTDDIYTFYTQANDGVRLWIDGQLVIDRWTSTAKAKTDSGSIALLGGRKHSIVLEFFEQGGPAGIDLTWATATMPRQHIPSTQLFAVELPAPALPIPSGRVSRAADTEAPAIPPSRLPKAHILYTIDVAAETTTRKPVAAAPPAASAALPVSTSTNKRTRTPWLDNLAAGIQ